MPASRTTGCKNIKIELTVMSIRLLVNIMIVVPVAVLIGCFVTAKIFQNEETYSLVYCNERNYIPSLSAITGVVPQVYFWRICVALVIVLKLFSGTLYYAYFNCMANNLNLESIKKATHWLSITCFWVNILDTIALCGVAFISDRENYWLHEKIFIIFAVTSFMYMILMITTFTIFRNLLTHSVIKSLHIKMGLFVLTAVLAIFLLIFYVAHIHWCVDNAFSWFSLSEYGFIGGILCFHWTMVFDFPRKVVKLEIINAVN